MKIKLFVLVALATTLAVATSARATDINFSFNGGGISSTGTFTVTPSTTAGVDEITGITGTFSDTNVGVSGAITGLYQPVSYVSNTLASPGVAFTTGGLSYDDLFYPAGDSPAICYDLNPVTHQPELTYPFSGGQLDIFGVAFDIAGPGGYVGELWSNGDVGGGPIVYAAALANATELVDDPNSGPGKTPPGRYGSLTTPEPGSLILLGTGVLGLLGVLGLTASRARKRELFP